MSTPEKIDMMTDAEIQECLNALYRQHQDTLYGGLVADFKSHRQYPPGGTADLLVAEQDRRIALQDPERWDGMS